MQGFFKVDIDELIKNAARSIRAERAAYDPILQTIVCHCREHKLQIGSPTWALHDVPPQESFTIWSNDALRHANTLVNCIYVRHTRVVHLRTIVAYKEFEVWVMNRLLFSVNRNTNRRRICPPLVDTTFGGISFTDPEFEIVNQYRKLYMPLPEGWTKAVELENIMWSTLHNRYLTVGGEHKDQTKSPHTIAKGLRQHIYDLLKQHDLGILIGHWAVSHLTGADSGSERLQIILNNDLTPEILIPKLGGLLRDITRMRFQHRTDEVSVPNDYWLERTTYYIGDSTERIALFETYNSATYELIPYVIREGVKVGGAYIICRMLMIDKIIIDQLMEGGQLKSDVAKAKTRQIMKSIDIVRNMDALKFIDQYEGVWKDPVIEKRKMIKMQDKKFPRYEPANHMRLYGKLREMT